MKKDVTCRYLSCVMENKHTKSIVVMAKLRKEGEILEEEEKESNNHTCTNTNEASTNNEADGNGNNDHQLKLSASSSASSSSESKVIHQNNCNTANTANDVTSSTQKECEDNATTCTNTPPSSKSSTSSTLISTSETSRRKRKMNDDVNNTIDDPETNKKKKKKKKHLYRPIIRSTCKLPQTHENNNDQKVLHAPTKEKKNEEEESKIIIIPTTPIIVTPEEAIEKNKNKNVQIEIYVKPLLVLDINGILCHRIREINKDLPFHLVEKLLEYMDWTHTATSAILNDVDTVDTAATAKEGKDNDNKDTCTTTTTTTTTISTNNTTSTIQQQSITNNENNTTDESQQLQNQLPTSFISVKQKHHIMKKEQLKQLSRKIYRKNNDNHNLVVAGTPIVTRTDLKDLLYYLDEHYTLAIWSSAKRKTVRGLVKNLFPDDISSRLLFVWHQSKCECVDANSSSSSSSSSRSSNSVRKSDSDNVIIDTTAKEEGMIEEEKKEDGSSNDKKFDPDENTNQVPSNDNSSSPALSSLPPLPQSNLKKVRRKTHHDDVIWVKHLSKVWSHFPLWNESNTLLIDDSPDKCPLKYQSNAVFPPPITGLNTFVLSSMLSTITTNTTAAAAPSSRDVPCGKEFGLFSVSGGECEIATTSKGRFEFDGVVYSDHDNEVKQRDFFEKLTALFMKDEDDGSIHNIEGYATCRKKLFNFLERHASGHMSWRKSTVSTTNP